MRTFSFNGIRADQFSIYVSSDTFLNSPAYAYEEYEVPSRNGALLKYDKHLQNVIRQFNCFCKDNVIVNLDAFKQALYANSGYMRIESDYDPDTYQMGYLAEGIEFEPFDASGDFSTQFTVTFSCMPQKWFKLAANKTVNNSAGGISRVYKRTNPFIQKMFSRLPISAIPTGDTFYLSSCYKAPAVTSQISASMSTGGFLALVAARFSGAFDYVALYSTDGNIPLQDANCPLTTHYYWIFTEPQGTLSEYYSVTKDGTTDVSYTSNVDAGTPVNLGNMDAIGASVTAVAGVWMPTLTSDPRPLLLSATGTLDGVQTWEVTARVGFELMSAAERADINNNWMDSSHTCDVVFDLSDLTVYIEKNGEKYRLDEYAEIDGTVGLCDHVSIHAITYTGTASTMTLTGKAEWYKV